jgi:hypothetical protein
MKKFYFSATIFFLLLFIFQASLNYAVDPYNIFGERKLFRSIKEIEFGRRVTVPYKSMNFSKEGVVVGSSRTLSLSGWEYFADKNFRWENLWINMANVDEISRVLRQAVTHNEVKVAIVGLDFEGFNADRIGTGISNEMYYAQTRDGQYNYWHLLGMLDVLFSFDTTKSSLLSLARWYIPTKLQDVFAEKSQNASPVAPKHFFSSDTNITRKVFEGFAFEDLSRGVSTFNSVKFILTTCYNSKVQLILFTNPAHASTLEGYRAVGVWQSYQEWLRKLASIVDDFNKTHPGADIKLWNYSGYNSINSSILSGDGLSNKYFVDEAHFSPLVGRFILDRSTGKHLASEIIPDDFGFILTSENVESYINRLEKERLRYLEGFPQ